MNPRVSIVITTRDRAAYVDRVFDSLAEQLGAPPFELIAVDNGSCDDTRIVVERRSARAAFPVRYLFEPQPNRGKARNRGIAQAIGRLVLFCDDDVALPRGWVAAHYRAHGSDETIVNGPILNVSSYGDRPKPRPSNYSRAYLCTCNASVPRSALERVGSFDESFDLYGWEDTELGVRLRESGIGWRFVWNAYLWHIKTPDENTVEVETRKAHEKARMAGRFVRKHPSRRARLATGAHPINMLRGRFLLPDWMLAIYAGLATGPRTPRWLGSLARAQLVDAVYTRELLRTLKEGERGLDGGP